MEIAGAAAIDGIVIGLGEIRLQAFEAHLRRAGNAQWLPSIKGRREVFLVLENSATHALRPRRRSESFVYLRRG